MTPHTLENAFIKFRGNSGYSRHGDTVSLFAERIENLDHSGITSGSLVLQLWGCPMPYTGGGLTGWKLAEWPLGILQGDHFTGPVNADVPGNFPERGDYAMVLVIAEWDGEDFNRIYDFQNYPNRDVFLHPRLEGLVGYRWIDNVHLVVDVERIHNPRDSYNMSGTLSLELWALSDPYAAGDFSGHALAGVTLGTLPGSGSWPSCSHELEICAPPPGTYTLVVMLREWGGSAYVTRDHLTFDSQVTFPCLTPARSLSEAAIGTNADEKREDTAQTHGTVNAATVAAPAGRSSHEPGSPVAEATRGSNKTHAGKSTSVPAVLANIKSIARWVLQRIKQQLTI